MKTRAVLVDVSIDQGGCFETSRPTTHSDPVYEVDGITHYCVDEHAGRGAGHLDLRAHQRHAALRARARRPRRRGRASSKMPGLQPGVNVDGRQGHPPGRRRGRPGMPYTPVDDVLGAHTRLARGERPTHGNRSARPSSRTSSTASPSTPPRARPRRCLNPATGEEIADVPLSTEEDVDRAVAAAKAAFDGWSTTTPGERATGAAEARRRPGGARRGARGPRGAERRQAAQRVPRGRDAGRWRQPALLRGRGAHASRARPPASTWRATRRSSGASPSAWSARSRRGTTR